MDRDGLQGTGNELLYWKLIMSTETRRQEYESIREEQSKLRREMARLEQRIETLLSDEAPAEFAGAGVASKAANISPTMVAAIPAPPTPPVELPPPLPVIPPPPSVAEPALLEASASTRPTPPTPPTVEKESWEVQIGTTWLVRAGVVLLLTSLAFLGSYLYQHVVPRLGPAPKVALLYLAAGALTGAGAWLERRQKNENEAESDPPNARGLHQYARIVFAGGLAAVYYVTYAAHWNPRLQVIQNSFLAGGLLLAWTAFMVFLAHRRNSETLATFAILLAYYTSAINEIAGFTLFSNLALTIGAVFLLRRHLWSVFPFASLLATFGSYGFWRYFHDYNSWLGHDAFPRAGISTGGLWIEGTFLAIYWLLFTWVTFSPGEKRQIQMRAATFAGLNNGAFFALSTWVLLADYPGSFWKWALGFGAVLLALGETGRRLPQRLDSRTEGTYQTQGILLVTWGIVSYFSGWHLTLTLAVESTALLVAAGSRESRLLLAAAGVVAFMSLLWAVDWIGANPALNPWMTGAAEGGFLVFNAWWSQRLRVRPVPAVTDEQTWDKFLAALAPTPAYFSFLGCAVWFLVIDRDVPSGPFLSPSLVLAAVVLTASVHLLRIGALAVYAQGYLLAALVIWLGDHSFVFQPGSQSIWNPLCIVGGMLAVGHWWQRKLWTGFPSGSWELAAAADAILIVIVLAAWLQPDILTSSDLWVAESAGLALLLFGYGIFTRYGFLAIAGQYFQLASVTAFCLLWQHEWNGNASEPLFALAPIFGSLIVLAVGAWIEPARLLPPRCPWWIVSLLYEAMTVVLTVAWGSRYFPHLEKFSFFCLLAGMIFVAGVWRKERRWLLWSGIPIIAGLMTYYGVYSQHERASFVQWLGIAILAAQQRFGRRQLPVEDFPPVVQKALMILATFVAWTWVSAWVSDLAVEGTFTLAAGWSLFAVVVFAAGFAWRESTYRWLGLVILACTLGRIILYDIWQLESLGRILSSFALGLVLLGIAFVYIKFQKQLRNWF